MDLLGGYKSDGDSSSSSSSSAASLSSSHSNKKNQQQPQPQSLNVDQQRPHNVDTSTTIESYKESSTSAAAAAAIDKRKQKGKRLLKLNAVLPPEILERLTRSTVLQRSTTTTTTTSSTGERRNTSAWSESDSDSYSEQDGDDERRRTRKINTKRPMLGTNFERRGDLKQDMDSNMTTTATTTTTTTTTTSMDSDLGLLLNDLKNHVPSSSSVVAVGHKVGQEKKEEKEEEKLGMAFMNVVSTSVIRKKRNGHDLQTVIDIHGDSFGTQSDSKLNACSNDSMGKVTSSEDRVGSNEPCASENIKTIEPSIQSRTAWTGIKRARNAAPSVSTATWTTDEVEKGDMQGDIALDVVESKKHESMTSSSFTNPTRKRSKKELEKALRAGDFDSLHDCTLKIDAPNQIPYNHVSSSSIVLEGGSGGGGGGSMSFGTSSGGLERYVPSEGMTVKQPGLSAKMRGKHQIHSLVVSASKYEADQRRMAAMGMGQQGKSKRADAKKKYGW